MSEILGTSAVEAEMVPMLFKEGDEKAIHLAPIVYIPDLNKHIIATLDELDKYVVFCLH